MERVTTFRTALSVSCIAVFCILIPSVAAGQADNIEADFGDAPENAAAGMNYPVTLATPNPNGPGGHTPIPDYYLGSCVDTEPDGQQSPDAQGDDLGPPLGLFGQCAIPDDDEDGIVFQDASGLLTSLTLCQTTVFEVTLWNPTGLSAFLYGYVDFNRDGDWNDPGEEIFGGGPNAQNPAAPLGHGVQYLSFNVPCSAHPTDPADPDDVTYVRFRLWVDNVGLPDDGSGLIDPGEVEDYAVDVFTSEEIIDWGDAPDPTYPTLWASNGAGHLLGVPGSPFMGFCVDGEPDGQPTLAADGDDINTLGPPVGVFGTCQNNDDEDGVAFVTPLIPGQQATVNIDLTNSPNQCLMDAWVDFGADGTFDEPADRIMLGHPLPPGAVHPVSFGVPLGAAAGTSYARFRCSTAGGLLPDGGALDGEVEDHRVDIEPAEEFQDWGDAVDTPGGMPTYNTLAANNGASHAIGAPGSPWMGLCVDGEADGQPTSAADGDDLSPGVPMVGLCGPTQDDEDGVSFAAPLVIGQQAVVNIDLTTSPNQCVMDAWVDFGIDGTFDEPADRIITGMPLPPGAVHPVGFGVPPLATPGQTFARFRCSINGVPSPRGAAPDGEVEDYTVDIEPPPDAFDFGDAPDPTYPTLLASTGANHLIGVPGSPFMGQCVDGESDGQPTALANGDDLGPGAPVIGVCQTPNDDEDGIRFATPLVPGQPATVDVDLTASPSHCVMDAWLDFDANGTFDEPADRIITGLPLLPGAVHPVNFPVPLSAVPGQTYARFRCSINGGLKPDGGAPDGEVEDHAVGIEPPEEGIDWGDAPDPTYPTVAVNNGANHLMGFPGSPFMGQCVDGEPNGQPTPPADGDDLGPGAPVAGVCQTPNDDEDGIVFMTPLIPGQPATVNVDLTASPKQCLMDAWVDFGADGVFDDPGDRIMASIALPQGAVHPVGFGVPLGAVPGPTYARFRCSTNGGLLPDGGAPDGEVEDHLVRIDPPEEGIDWGDAPDPTYPTVAINNGANHLMGFPGSPFMGQCVDGEPDGQPTPLADGDDLGPGAPVAGACQIPNDDEDGAVFVTPLIPGQPAIVNIDMTASPNQCVMDAWVDFGADGTFDEPADRIMVGIPLPPGIVHPVGFGVPLGALPGQTYARFRCSINGGLGPDGRAPDGEVEDHLVAIDPPEEGIDWGDAPDPAYPTLAINNGANHLMGFPGSPFMGQCVDAEPDGRPTTPADGDDLSPGAPVVGVCRVPNDDEDGVGFATPLVPGQQATVNVDLTVSPNHCVMDAWVDFGADGTFDEPGDRIMTGLALPPGVVHPVNFVVPPTPHVGQTYARFRCSINGVPRPDGSAPDGEVEDYLVNIGTSDEIFDWGDAPDPAYPTLAINNGASHLIGVPGSPFMGLCVDAERDGQPTPPADGDDLNALGPPMGVIGACQNNDDEDGIVFVTPLIPGQQATVNVDLTMSPNQCVMDAWVDFRADGRFDEPVDRIMTGLPLPPGLVHPISFPVPVGAFVGRTYARFRCSINGGLLPDGGAPDGEVEDHLAYIGPPEEIFDWGDAPDPTYPTLATSTGANHLIGVPGSPFMGLCVDAEPDGQPTAPADGDDLNALGPPLGVIGACQNNDDEDGIGFVTPLVPGQQATVNVDLTTSPNQCLMDAWLDFGADGTFDEPADRIMTGLPLPPGLVHPVTFVVPLSAVPGPTYARFRCSINGGLSPRGGAPDGEVEDYWVRIDPPAEEFMDWGDAPDPTYPTLAINSGASHLIGLPGSPFMGLCVDGELDGQPTPPADGDDLGPAVPPFAVVGACQPPNDDEDGIAFVTPLILGQQATVNVDLTVSPSQCVMDAWLDFGADGTFDEPGDRIMTGLPLAAGLVHPVNFGVPTTAVPGPTHARFRCSINGGLSPRGGAPDGEVEDYALEIKVPEEGIDWGDAPDLNYLTLAVSNGANHLMGMPGSPFMGLCVDGEPDGQPTPLADGDDLGPGLPVVGACQTPTDDEDGAGFVGPVLTGQTATTQIDLTASPSPCVIDAWVDFDANGTFDEPADRIITGQFLPPGVVHSIPFNVPITAVPQMTYARFRCSSNGVPSPFGSAPDGEVEDYTVRIEPGPEGFFDWGDAPDAPGAPSYPTLAGSNGAHHPIWMPGSPYMGQCVDAEANGQPTPPADGDDINTLGPPLHTVGTCVNADDEDGVVWLTPLVQGVPATISIDMTGSQSSCLGNAWIDYNGNATFSDPGEQILFDYPLGFGMVHTILFTVPGSANAGNTYARFRCSTPGGDPPFGPSADGEVEDYQVTIENAEEIDIDWGDAPDDPAYPGFFFGTLAANLGASHILVDGGPVLGTLVDAEPDGSPSPVADGDDLGPPLADEDGTPNPIVFDLRRPTQCVLLASATGGQVDAWVDWDKSRTFDPDEYWSGPGGPSFAHAGGIQNICFTLPGDQLSGKTFARFRISRGGGLSPLGLAPDGEVEDYYVAILDYVRFNLDVILEGPYVSGSMSTALNTSLPTTQPYSGAPWLYLGTESITPMPQDVVDWLLMETRFDSTAASKVVEQAVLLLSNGTVVDTSGTNPPRLFGGGFDSLYVVLRHRNHLDVMSATKLDVSTGTAALNFTAPGAAYGTNPMKDLGGGPGPFGMFAGDGWPDGVLQALDLGVYLNEASSGVVGYSPGDYNLDTFPQALDYNLYLANKVVGAQSRVP